MKTGILTIVDVLIIGVIAKALFSNYKAFFKTFFNLGLPLSPIRRKNSFYDPISFYKMLLIVVVLGGLVELEQYLFY